MKTAMYLFANQGIGMSPGKLAAQVSHAAVEAYRLTTLNASQDDQKLPILDHWHKRGYTKLVMEARDTEHLISIHTALVQKGYNTSLIIDEGRTEIAPQTPTALGVEVVDRDDEQVQFDFSDFRTLKVQTDPEVERWREYCDLPWHSKLAIYFGLRDDPREPCDCWICS